LPTPACFRPRQSTGGGSNSGGIALGNVDTTGTLYAFLISGARSSGANKLVPQLASVATPANPTTITAKNGSWTNTATLTDIRLSLDAASPTALPAGGTAALYGLGTGT
jgi:hypothetical protein